MTTIFKNTPSVTSNMERTARIPVFEETKEKLLSKKRKLQAQLDKSITWDEFLLKDC